MRMEDENKLNFVWIAALLIITFMLSACGMTNSNSTNDPLVDDNNGGTILPPITFPDDGQGDPLDFSFSVSGSQGEDPEEVFTVNTDSVLRLRVTSGPAQAIDLPGVSFTARYGCVQYAITVNGRTADTVILSVEGEDNQHCPDAPTSVLMDFSDRLGGPDAPTITVSDARYDFYCRLWFRGVIGGGYNLYCPIRAAFKNHILSGTLKVQVNGTRAP